MPYIFLFQTEHSLTNLQRSIHPITLQKLRGILYLQEEKTKEARAAEFEKPENRNGNDGTSSNPKDEKLEAVSSTKNNDEAVDGSKSELWYGQLELLGFRTNSTWSKKQNRIFCRLQNIELCWKIHSEEKKNIYRRFARFAFQWKLAMCIVLKIDFQLTSFIFHRWFWCQTLNVMI